MDAITIAKSLGLDKLTQRVRPAVGFRRVVHGGHFQ
jgi:hypothetical protein